MPAHPGETNMSAHDILTLLINIIVECGQDPVTQLAGYLMTDDPIYLPDCVHARSLADSIGRDLLLEVLLQYYADSS